MDSEVASTVADRAYAMAEMWANDHERLAAMMATRMQPEEQAEICEHLAKAFKSISDEAVPREKTYRDCFLCMMMIYGIVVERICLPVAEGLARIDHAGPSARRRWRRAEGLARIDHDEAASAGVDLRMAA